MLGGALLGFILAFMILTAYLVIEFNSINTSSVAGVIAIIGFLVGILLLPSLTKFKVASIELETVPPKAPTSIELKTMLIPMPEEAVFVLTESSAPNKNLNPFSIT
jgi:hypothetical protein